MNEDKINKWLNIIVTSLFILIVSYIVYVVETATHTPGCTNSYDLCISSHTEINRRFNGKYWHDWEHEICDEYKTIEYDCECVTYHWFWGDSKPLNKTK